MVAIMTTRTSAFSFTLSLLLCFCVLVQAQTTTAQVPTSTPLHNGTHNATGTDTVGWVGNPKRRGTLTLLIECITTIFACTWTVLHLNVPAITDSTTTRMIRKAKWMAITFLFPEFIFAKAVCELRFALEMLDWMSASIEARSSEFETLSEVKIENGRSAWVLWSWAVEFEPAKRVLYRLLLWETPSASMGLFYTTLANWVSKLRSVLHYHSTPNVAPTDSRAGLTDGPPRDHRSRTIRVVSVKEEGGLVPEEKKFFERTFSDKDCHFNGSAVVRVQKWTLTHAYYANMGGIIARKRMKEWTEEADHRAPFLTHSYSVLRGDHLAVSTWKWEFVSQKTWELGHPLKELRLSAEDIKDKSKADWIAKIFSVIQIARLIFDLVTRGVVGQPVTQLEIATASFSIFAIVTYLANWWKPKDISQPTRLDTVTDQGTRGDLVERETEPFFSRLWSPAPPLHLYEHTMSAGDRIRNDELWIRRENSILTWVLIATSCLLFGGIHCVAWSFQFPTHAEQLAWRIAALVSTTLPVIALAGSFTILRYRPGELKRRQKLAVIDTLKIYHGFDMKNTEVSDDGWWRSFTTEVAKPEWHKWLKSQPERDMIRDMDRLKWELQMLDKLRDSLLNVIDESGREEEKLINNVWNVARSLKMSGDHDLPLRGQYEEWIKGIDRTMSYENGCNLGGQPYGGPEGVFQWFFSRCALKPDSLPPYQEVRKGLDIRAQRLSRLLNIISGIIYTVSRIVLLAIMFSCLRAAPDRVYDTPDWTRFVPSFS